MRAQDARKVDYEYYSHETHRTTPPKLSAWLSVSNRLPAEAMYCMDFRQEETSKSDAQRLDYARVVESCDRRESRRSYMFKLCQRAASPSTCWHDSGTVTPDQDPPIHRLYKIGYAFQLGVNHHGVVRCVTWRSLTGYHLLVVTRYTLREVRNFRTRVTLPKRG